MADGRKIKVVKSG